MRPFKRHKVTSTHLRYDNLHQQDDDSEADDSLRSRGFRSTRDRRFQFSEQGKREFQDEEDIEHEMESMKVISDFKDLSDVLELVLNEADPVDTREQNEPIKT